MSLEDRLKSLGATQDPADPWGWSMDHRWLDRFRFEKPFEKRQEEFLEEVFHASNLPWFVAAEDLAEEGWDIVDEMTRRLPANYCAWAFLNTAPITYGGWLLYSAAESKPVSHMPDPFRKPQAMIRSWLGEQQISILVASWPDDMQWKVFINSLT
jgi:hypothetical protein